MESGLTTVGLPIALAIIMFGLGLGLTGADFRRVAREPKAVAVALGCQLVLLPLICFGLVVLADLPALLAIGMMLLAASPGGTTANLFSHLFHGDVALNITLTAVNSVISVVTLPRRQLASRSPTTTAGEDVSVASSARWSGLRDHAGSRRHRDAGPRRTRRASPHAWTAPSGSSRRSCCAVLILGILIDERENIGDYLADVGLIATAFCAISLVVGYVVPKAVGVVEGQAIASSMEIGVHNSTLAIFIAIEVLEAVTISIPAAVYSLVMFPLAAIWGSIVSRRVRRPVAA